MPDQDYQTQTQVLVVEPGWAAVHFTAPPPEAARRFFFLNRTAEDWLAEHPQYKLESVHPVEIQGELRGLNVFYHAEPLSQKLSVKIDDALRERYGMEYMEAVVAEALSFATSHQRPGNTFAIVNRRQIAVVVDRRRESGFVTSLETVEAAASAKQRAQLRHWLEKMKTQLFVFPLPDGFEPDGPGA